MARASEPKPALCTAHARSIAALVIAQDAAREFDDAERTYKTLIELTDTAQYATVREERARAAFNLVSHLSKAQQWQRAETVCRDLESLADTFGREPPLREQLARAAFNLFDEFRKVDKVDRAAEIFETLSGLSRKHPKEAGLRRQCAKAALNLCVSYAPKDPDTAEAIYRELETLAQMYPEDDEVSVYRSSCVLNLVRVYLLRDNVTRARSLALSAAAILRSPELRATIAVSQGSESARQLFIVVDALLESAEEIGSQDVRSPNAS